MEITDISLEINNSQDQPRQSLMYAEDRLLNGKQGILQFIERLQCTFSNLLQKQISFSVVNNGINLLNNVSNSTVNDAQIIKSILFLKQTANKISDDFDLSWSKSSCLKLLYQFVYFVAKNQELKNQYFLNGNDGVIQFFYAFKTYIQSQYNNDRQLQQLKLLINSVQNFRDNLLWLVSRYSQALILKDIILQKLSNQKINNIGFQKNKTILVFTKQPGMEVPIVMQNKKLQKLQKLVTQKINNKIMFYNRFIAKSNQIIKQSKTKLNKGDQKGFIMLQGLRIKFAKQNKYQKILEAYTKQKRINFLNEIQTQFSNKRQNIVEVVKLANITTSQIKNTKIGINDLLNKNWISNNQNVKPIYDKLNQFNQKFKNYITGIFMTNNFVLNWQRTKMILRKAARQVSKDKKQTTAENILNQLYDKIAMQGQLDSPSERMNKLKQATKAYAEQIHNLSIKINQMKNTESQNNPNQKILSDQQYNQVSKRIQYVRNILQKVSDNYQELMVLTSSSNKGKFYINLMLLFLGNKKVRDIQQVLNQIPQYNRATDGFGFQRLEKKGVTKREQ